MAAGGIALVKVVVLGLGAIIACATTAFPAWFKFTVPVSMDGGKTIEQKTVSVGLFYMDKGGDILQTDLIFVDKASNAKLIPGAYKVGQIFYGLGSIGMLVCFATSVVYCCRKYRSATGEMCLAGGVFPCALCTVLGIIFLILGTVASPNEAWETFPVPNHYVIVKAHPDIAIDIVFYVAAAAAIICLAGSALCWLHACSLCKDVEKVRYRMLHAPLTDDERGVSPGTVYKFGGHHTGFRYDGYSKSREVDF